MNKEQIFISHAEKDKDLAEILVTLLILGASVSREMIFCSSLEGMGIPKGTDFVKFIKEKLGNPKLVIMLLSPNYYDSIFCLCELGASWALSHNIFPILVPPLDYSDVKDVLTGVECGIIHENTTLCELRDKIVDMLGIKSSTARWDIELEKFTKNLETTIKGLLPPSRVSFAEYAKLKKSYEDTLSEFKKCLSENGELRKINAKITQCKDKEAVNKVIIESLDDWGKFKALVENVKKAAKTLPNVVLEAIYYHVSCRTFKLNRDDDPDQCKEAEFAQENGYLKIDDRDGTVSIKGDPTISEVLDQIDALSKFLEEKAKAEFYDSFSGEYKFDPDISNRRLWVEFFDL